MVSPVIVQAFPGLSNLQAPPRGACSFNLSFSSSFLTSPTLPVIRFHCARSRHLGYVVVIWNGREWNGIARVRLASFRATVGASMTNTRQPLQAAANTTSATAIIGKNKGKNIHILSTSNPRRDKWTELGSQKPTPAQSLVHADIWPPKFGNVWYCFTQIMLASSFGI